MDIIRGHATSAVKQHHLDASNTERSNLFLDGRLLEERCQELPQGLSVPLQVGTDQHNWGASLRRHAAGPCVRKVALNFDRQASKHHTVEQGRRAWQSLPRRFVEGVHEGRWRRHGRGVQGTADVRKKGLR